MNEFPLSVQETCNINKSYPPVCERLTTSKTVSGLKTSSEPCVSVQTDLTVAVLPSLHNRMTSRKSRVKLVTCTGEKTETAV